MANTMLADAPATLGASPSGGVVLSTEAWIFRPQYQKS